MPSGAPQPSRPTRNVDAGWNEFDACDYYERNYESVSAEDQVIVERLRQFMTEGLRGRRGLRALDVGAGTNLYPALSVLPFVSEVDFVDISVPNLAWLVEELRGGIGAWLPYWSVLGAEPEYAAVANPGDRLLQVATTSLGSVFDLRESEWDIALMFFVAESITEDREEFRDALRRVLRSIRPGGCFSFAFMLGSGGYTVGTQRFPAVALTAGDIAADLADLGVDAPVLPVEVDSRVRPGYEGMATVMGRVHRGAG